MESDLPVDTGIYSLINISQTLISFVLFLLVAILSIRILAILWPPSPPADFPSLCHNIKATYLQLLRHRMEGMRIRDQPQFPGLWPDSESALRTLISAVNETSCLVGKRQLVKLLHEIIADFTKLQQAVDEYHTEIDISCYRTIHAHDNILIALQDATRPRSRLFRFLVASPSERLRRAFAPLLREHQSSVSRISRQRDRCWAVLHSLYKRSSQLGCLMAELNPDFYQNSNLNPLDVVWFSFVTKRDVETGRNPAFSFGGVSMVSAWHGKMVSHLLAGRDILRAAREELDGLAKRDRSDVVVTSYDRQVGSIRRGLNELRKARTGPEEYPDRRTPKLFGHVSQFLESSIFHFRAAP